MILPRVQIVDRDSKQHQAKVQPPDSLFWNDASPCIHCTQQKHRPAHAILIHYRLTISGNLAIYVEMEEAEAKI